MKPQITNFSIAGYNGSINKATKIITITVPFGTNITAQVPTVTFIGDVLDPSDSTATNFTTPVTYKVSDTAATPPEEETYTVEVTVEPDPAIAIKAKKDRLIKFWAIVGIIVIAVVIGFIMLIYGAISHAGAPDENTQAKKPGTMETTSWTVDFTNQEAGEHPLDSAQVAVMAFPINANVSTTGRLKIKTMSDSCFVVEPGPFPMMKGKKFARVKIGAMEKLLIIVDIPKGTPSNKAL